MGEAVGVLCCARRYARLCRFCCGGVPREKMHVARLFCAGLAWKHRGQRRLALAEAIEGKDYVVECFEAIHALGAAAKLSGCLRAAEQKHTENRYLAAVEVENFLQAMLVFSDAAVSAAGWAREPLFLQGSKRVAYRTFIKSHDRFAIIFLITGVDQSVERQRIVIGSRNIFFNQGAEHANFDFDE